MTNVAPHYKGVLLHSFQWKDERKEQDDIYIRKAKALYEAHSVLLFTFNWSKPRLYCHYWLKADQEDCTSQIEYPSTLRLDNY